MMKNKQGLDYTTHNEQLELELGLRISNLRLKTYHAHPTYIQSQSLCIYTSYNTYTTDKQIQSTKNHHCISKHELFTNPKFHEWLFKT